MEQLRPIKQEFEQNYFLQEPFSDYVNMVCISDLRMIQKRGERFDLKAGETLDDLCIDVGFRVQPPTELEFPAEYQGVTVFYVVIGEFKPL